MTMRYSAASRLRLLRARTLAFLLAVSLPICAFGQSVVQHGPFGVPSQVMDETQVWTTPLSVASDHDVELYIPDVSSPDWLRQNYATYESKGVYTLSIFTFYKTTKACQINQAGWGNSDAEHINACADIGYRVRQALVDPQQKSVTLIMAAMVDHDGQLDVSSIQKPNTFRTWDQLDANTLEAVKKANGLVKEQMRIYDEKQQSKR
ncbi:hypothetical protein [Granulicella sibirica]|uniref:Uncharacterized protein n=1 Tax=Granulicella sibirica TaxID=2479048 RepID=A0A4Q0T110_9BACT|nr:hypothetical protein [Granulicella sibirica]RXH57303.1 hypothetical protein GRAN_0613 [Granulicella sibirica]